MRLLSSPLSTRNQIACFLNDKRLIGQAVEIGTHRAEFADLFLNKWRGKMLHCVDPWSVPRGYESQVKFLNQSVSRRADYRKAQELLKDRPARLLRMTSEKAAPLFADGSLDFVYVDGDHSYEMVKKDLELWWPKLKQGGIMAGHDFVCPPIEDWPGVQQAVLEFAGNLDLYLIVEEGGQPWTFYTEKQ